MHYRRSGLDIQDFAHAFSAFCLLSYDKRKFSFSYIEALELFEKGKSLISLSYDSDAILQDTTQSVCLLIEEGLEITFAHSSFQEFFVAKYIQSSPENIKARLVKKYSAYIGRDDVIPLLYEIAPIDVEKYYVLPFLDKLKSQIKLNQKVGKSHFLRYLQLAFTRIGFIGGKILLHLSERELVSGLMFITTNILKFEDEDYYEEEKLLEELCINEYKNTEIETDELKTNHAYFRQLSCSEGSLTGIAWLQKIMDLIPSLRNKHATAEASIEEILSSKFDSEL